MSLFIGIKYLKMHLFGVYGKYFMGKELRPNFKAVCNSITI
jgi:hypothetical protein